MEKWKLYEFQDCPNCGANLEENTAVMYGEPESIRCLDNCGFKSHLFMYNDERGAVKVAKGNIDELKRPPRKKKKIPVYSSGRPTQDPKQVYVNNQPQIQNKAPERQVKYRQW